LSTSGEGKASDSGIARAPSNLRQITSPIRGGEVAASIIGNVFGFKPPKALRLEDMRKSLG
jgi:ribulose 1,5-bisphosphate carboxylase large subunit-like protein